MVSFDVHFLQSMLPLDFVHDDFGVFYDLAVHEVVAQRCSFIIVHVVISITPNVPKAVWYKMLLIKSVRVFLILKQMLDLHSVGTI